jgi:hypothetical protein
MIAGINLRFLATIYTLEEVHNTYANLVFFRITQSVD